MHPSYWAYDPHTQRIGRMLWGSNGEDLSKSVNFTWSKTIAKPNTWKQMVQLLFSLFEVQGLFFRAKGNDLMTVIFL